MDDRRLENRKSLLRRVELQLVDGTGELASVPALMEDRSASGVGLRLRQPVQPGTRVTVKIGPAELSGTVRRCLREGYEYVVGIRLEAPDASAEKAS